MNKLRRFIGQNLRRQLLAGGFLALGISIGSLFFFWQMADLTLTRTPFGLYVQKHVQEYQAKQEMNRLQTYIRENAVTADHLSLLDNWCYAQFYRCPALFILEGDTVTYSMYLLEESSVSSLSDAELLLNTQEMVYAFSYTGDLTLQNGTAVTACLFLYTGGYIGVLSIILGIILAFITFAVIFIILVRSKIRYITALKKELDILAGGDLTYCVTEQGSDELGELASGINHMRQSILEKQNAEERARQANAELITAVSHDLRSPLTALIGYLEILKRLPAGRQDEAPYLVDNSLGKALQIKTMSDRLFEYFLVSQTEIDDISTEPYDAAVLIQGMLEDLIFSLEVDGFTVISEDVISDGVIIANPELLQRVFDNLYSNLKKYADHTENIVIRSKTKQNQLTLTFRNGIRRDISEAESNRIGIRTCEKIMAAHQGFFTCRQNGDVYESELQFCITTR